MSEAHTPAPWAWQFFGPHLALIEARGERKIILDVTPKGVVRLRKGHIMRPITMVAECEEHPDFRLIKAAPDLLAALKAICRDATECECHGEPSTVDGIQWDDIIAARAAIAKAGGAA